MPTATRCNGQQAEICDGAIRWTVVENCNDVGEQNDGTWACCRVTPDAGAGADGGSVRDYICVPSNQCGGAS